MASLRKLIDLTLPGASIGICAAFFAGGLVAGSGQPLAWALVAAFSLGIPVGLAGAGYDVLLAQGRIPSGRLYPIVLYWAIAYPIARVVHESATDLVAGRAIGFPGGIGPFLSFQAVLSVGLAIGFYWLHEMVAANWWPRVARRSPTVNRFVEEHMRHAATLKEYQASTAGGRVPGARRARRSPAQSRRGAARKRAGSTSC